METMRQSATDAKPHSRRKLDLTGQRYGRLTVLRPAENIGKRTAWVCRCDCGRNVTVKSTKLRSGMTLSCGCARPTLVGRNGETVTDIARLLTMVDGTCVEMLRNKTPRCNNTSGVVGVEWRSSHHNWRASICFKGQRHYLGVYNTFEDAVKARKEAEAKYHDAFLHEFDLKQTAAQCG